MDFDNQAPMDALCEKWEPLLEHDALPRIEDSYKKKVTSVLLENQEKALREQYIHESTPANAMGGNFSDPQVGSAGNLECSNWSHLCDACPLRWSNWCWCWFRCSGS